jgi:hypothetical protein
VPLDIRSRNHLHDHDNSRENMAPGAQCIVPHLAGPFSEHHCQCNPVPITTEKSLLNHPLTSRHHAVDLAIRVSFHASCYGTCCIILHRVKPCAPGRLCTIYKTTVPGLSFQRHHVDSSRRFLPLAQSSCTSHPRY